jgi:hypothetical protein
VIVSVAHLVLPPRLVDGVGCRLIDGHEARAQGGTSVMPISKRPMCWRA